MSLADIDQALAWEVGRLKFADPVTHVYNPLEYAWGPHAQYLERFGEGEKEVLLLGMNPGPFGMGQTGVPFGDVGLVRDWMGIGGPVGKPLQEHPKRPVLGFDCARSEVSGSRLWGWAKQRFKTPEAFFERFFVINYCPLIFMETSGRNRTPDKLPASERQPLLEACDASLREAVQLLKPEKIVGVGAWATRRGQEVLGETYTVGTILHPSPASPKANRDWAGQAEAQLRAMQIAL